MNKQYISKFGQLILPYSLFISFLLAPFLFDVYSAYSVTKDVSINSNFDITAIINSQALYYFAQYLSVIIASIFLYVYATHIFAQRVANCLPINSTLSEIICIILSYIAIVMTNQGFYPGSGYQLAIFYENSGAFWIGIAIFSSIVFLLLAKHYRLTLTVCLIFFLSYIDTPNKEHNSSKPNIIMIGIDSLRPELIKQYMPFLKEQLANSTVINNAYTPFARTYPAWMSIVTGRHPANHGARFNLQPEEMLANDNLYLPKLLQEHGYTTIYAADERRFSNLGSTQGFQHVIGPRTGVSDFVLGDYADFPTTNLLLLTPLGKWLLPELYGNRAAEHLYRPETFSSLLEYGLDSIIRDKPILLATHFCLPHWPYRFIGEYPTLGYEEQPFYPSNLEAVDKQIQELMIYLKERDLLRNSIIVFLSDHGESWGYFKTAFKDKNGIPYESSDFGHGMNILSSASHEVLLAFKGLAIHPEQITRPASLTDIAPTLLSALKLADPHDHQKMDGRDLTIAPNQSSELAFESGVILAAANTSNPNPRAVAREGAHRFTIKETGYLRLKSSMVPEMIDKKQVGLRLEDDALYLVNHQGKHQIMSVDHKADRYIWLKPKDRPTLNPELMTGFCKLYGSQKSKAIEQLCQ